MGQACFSDDTDDWRIMKYSTVLFDWGDTLSNNAGTGDPNGWVANMLQHLYESSYRLGIISNTHRYQDAHYIRRKLEHIKCCRYFECIISSAMYGYHKPDKKIFQKLVDFMEIDPTLAIMVGDSEYCDGGGQLLGMGYLYVKPGEKWDDKLYNVLEDSFPPSRKLTRLSEFGLIGDSLFVKMRHLSEALSSGDRLLLDQEEYVVSSVPYEFTKDDVIKPNPADKFIEIKVRPIGNRKIKI